MPNNVISIQKDAVELNSVFTVRNLRHGQFKKISNLDIEYQVADYVRILMIKIATW